MAHAGEEIRFGEVGFFRSGSGALQFHVRFLQRSLDALAFQLDLFASGVIRTDQQVADDSALIVTQRRDRHDGRKAAAILTDIGQFVNVFDAERSLEN